MRDREFQVLYPSMNTEKFIRNEKKSRSIEPKHENDPKRIFLSINRYERKKNLNLAIEAFGMLFSYTFIKKLNHKKLIFYNF